MSDIIDIYDGSDHALSSDEFDDDDDDIDDIYDDEDDLMNAVCSQTISSVPKNEEIDKNKKVREIKLLQKRRKFCTIYKKKSVKWLNNKQNRNSYKKDLLNFIKDKNARAPKIPVILETGRSAVKVRDEIFPQIISLHNTDVEISSSKNIEPFDEVKRIGIGDDLHITENKKDEPISASQTSAHKTDCKQPPMECDVNDESTKCSEQHIRKNPSLYEHINESFPKYDEVIENHIKSTNPTFGTIEANIGRVLAEVETLDELIKTKEREWNKLLHLKTVKEQILTRLVRTKRIMELGDNYSDVSKYTLSELKHLESKYSTRNTPIPSSTSSTQQIIENRANMKSEDLEKERSITSRLKSILVSNNILSSLEKPSNHSVFSKDSSLRTNVSAQSLSQSYQYFEKDVKPNIGRQGPLKDVKSIIADFRQNNPEVHPRVGKRIKLYEPIPGINNQQKHSYVSQPNDGPLSSMFHAGNEMYASKLEKLLNNSCRSNDSIRIEKTYPQEYNFTSDSPKNVYRLQNFSNEFGDDISVTPVSSGSRYYQKENNYSPNTEKLLSVLHKNIEQNLICLNELENGKHRKEVGNNFSGPEVRICQECRIHEAKFVCAGCGDQWYCSRNCQIIAWDKHSDTCIE